MKRPFWHRVCDFYYDPFFWVDGVPLVSPLPRVLPRTRCWVLAVWFALWDREPLL